MTVERTEHTVQAGDLSLHAEVFEGDGPPFLLVMGLGAQMLLWPDGFCEALAARGHRVVRFDNRDIGLSTWLSQLGTPDIRAGMVRLLLGRPITAPYSLTDMAVDTLAVADHFALDRPVIVGASMGGMIAQRLALLAPERIGGIASVMSSPRALFIPRIRTLLKLLTAPGPGRQASIDHALSLFAALGSQTLPRPDEEIIELAGKLFDRGAHPEGFVRQFAAILADGDRTELLASITLPRVVIHGDEDRLIPLDNGIRTAMAMNAPLVVVPGMGHDLPRQRWEMIIDALVGLAAP